MALRWGMVALIMVLAGAALLVWSFPPGNLDEPFAQESAVPSPARNALRARLQNNFDLASRGMASRQSKMAVMPRDNSAGLLCDPANLNRNRPTFRIVLPIMPDHRKGILAALVPDGSLRIIYVSYGHDAADPEDLIIPSRSIDWERVRTRNDFVVDVNKFEALRPNKDKPEPLFRQAGVYQFALLNGERDLLELDKTPFWVIAGCVVRWQP